MISVAVMIITLSFANGFQETVSQKIFSFWGHIRVQEKQPDKSVIAEETPIVMNDSLVTLIKQNPAVLSIHPFATRYAILKTKDEIEGVLIKGLDSTYDFNHLQQFIKQGRRLTFNDSSYSREIMISAFTARQLKLSAGGRILIYFIRPDGSLRPDKLTIAGIFILRKKMPLAERPYKAFGYPVLPAIYIVMAALFCTALIIYKPLYTWPGLIIVIIGIPIYYISQKNATNR